MLIPLICQVTEPNWSGTEHLWLACGDEGTAWGVNQLGLGIAVFQTNCPSMQGKREHILRLYLLGYGNQPLKRGVMMNTTHDEGVKSMLLGTVLPSKSQQPHLELNIYSNSYTHILPEL